MLAEFGCVIPDTAAVAVHDSTADLRYLVLPVTMISRSCRFCGALLHAVLMLPSHCVWTPCQLRLRILQARPAGAESLTRSELEALVTRDTMVGVCLCKPLPASL